MNRTVALLSLALCLHGCVGRQPATASPPGGLPWVALVRPAQGNATTAALVAAITEHNAIREVTSTTRQSPVSRLAAIRKRLKQGRQDYFTTYMDRAQQQLKKALRLAQSVHAEGLEPKELAEIHLYLAAVAHATQKPRQARAHLDAALRYFPTLELDESLFSPQLREALEKRSRVRKTVELRIRTAPAGATILWDGKAVGKSPVTLPEQGMGEHYLVASHPLHKARRERIVVSTAAQLELKLEPASPGEIVAGLQQHPELAERGLGLLGVNAVVWVEAADDGAVARSLTRSGPRQARVAQGADSGELTRIARSLPGAPTAMTKKSQPKKSRSKKKTTSLWRRYWWAWTAAGVVVVGAAVAIPLAVGNGSDPTGRPVVMEIPWP